MQPLPHQQPLADCLSNSPPSRSHKPSPDIDQPPVRENELTDVKSQVKMISQCRAGGRSHKLVRPGSGCG